MVVNTEINIAINIIDFLLAPIQIIIKGPSATFGKAFIIVNILSVYFDIFLIFIISPPYTLSIKTHIIKNITIIFNNISNTLLYI